MVAVNYGAYEPFVLALFPCDQSQIPVSVRTYYAMHITDLRADVIAHSRGALHYSYSTLFDVRCSAVVLILSQFEAITGHITLQRVYK